MQTELFPQSPEDFVLPDKWYVRRTQKNKELINQYFSELNRKKYTGPSTQMMLPYDYMHFPAFKNNRHPIGRTTNMFPRRGYTEITFEQFKNHVMKKEEIVIVDWFIRGSKQVEQYLSTQKNRRTGINGNFQNVGYFLDAKGKWEWEFVYNLEPEKEITLEKMFSEKWFISGGKELIALIKNERTPWNGDSKTCAYWKENGVWHMRDKYKMLDRIEITVEQYKKFTMKKDKKLLGYKLKFAEYEKAALKLAGGDFIKNSNIDFTAESMMTRIFSEVGLLDVWFEPVYEVEPQLPMISVRGTSYSGVILGKDIKYGCALLPICWFSHSDTRHIQSFSTSNDVFLSKEIVSDIRKYLDYHGIK